MNIDKQHIIDQLPYRHPFLFVDTISYIDKNSVSGSFHLREDLDFYKGHFKAQPVTPGVILIEIMAQIGLACLGIFLASNDENVSDQQLSFALCSSEVDFLKPVYPGETVTVEGKKIFFRFGKLSCEVRMMNEAGTVVCEGKLAGIQTNSLNENTPYQSWLNKG